MGISGAVNGIQRYQQTGDNRDLAEGFASFAAAEAMCPASPELNAGGMGPVLQGRVGEAMSEAEAISAGETPLASQVTFDLPSGARTRTDLITRTPKGEFKAREAKMGPTADLTGPQKEFEKTVNSGGTLIPRGKNAQKTGLTPGVPTNAVKHFEKDKY